MKEGTYSRLLLVLLLRDTFAGDQKPPLASGYAGDKQLLPARSQCVQTVSSS